MNHHQLLNTAAIVLVRDVGRSKFEQVCVAHVLKSMDALSQQLLVVKSQ